LRTRAGSENYEHKHNEEEFFHVKLLIVEGCDDIVLRRNPAKRKNAVRW
jgi:hypothetical protein